MAKKDPRKAAEKWARNLKQAAQDIKDGVDRVDVAPTHKAADKIDKMLQKLLEAFNDGRVEAGLRAVSLEDWKKAFKEKGIPAIQRGVEGSKSDMAVFLQELMDYQEGLKAELEQMPDMTIDDSVARAEKWIRGMGKFKRTKK